MGISKQGENYKVFLQIPEPSKNITQVKIVTKTGATESRVDLLHLKVIIMEKEYTKQGVTDTISGFMRSRDVSPKALVAGIHKLR